MRIVTPNRIPAYFIGCLLFLGVPICLRAQLVNRGASIRIDSGIVLRVDSSIRQESAGNQVPLMQNSGTIQTNGNWWHDGSLQYTGTGLLALAGDGPQVITGTTLYDLLISGSGFKSTSGVSSVAHRLDFTGNGILRTGADTLILGPAATMNETVAAYLEGWVRTQRTVAQNTMQDFGGLGVQILARGASPGQTDFVRGTGSSAIQSGSSNLGIARLYRITPVNNNGLNADIIFAYRDLELNSLPESNLILFQSTDGGNNWSWLGQVARDAASNTLTMTGINSFGRLTLGSSSSPLPVTWLYFTGSVAPIGNQLNWATAQETNTAGFEIQRSATGARFEAIGSVPAAGNSSNDRRYTFPDNNVADGQCWYYRLRQWDLDGHSTYSNIIRLQRSGGTAELSFHAAPNPFTSFLQIQANRPTSCPLQVRLLNGGGSLVFQTTFLAPAINFKLDQLPALAAGVYFLQIKAGSEWFLLKVQHR